MNRYRATREFYFVELDAWAPEDNYQRIEKDEIVGELEAEVAVFIKDKIFAGIWLRDAQKNFLEFVDTVADPVIFSGRNTAR
jgi:hypothetical protein